MAFSLALLPITLILILMIGFRWGAARAGGVGYLSSLLIAWLYFGAGAQVLAYAHLRALLLSTDVLLIIWAAFLLFRVADEAGAIQMIGHALPHLTSDRVMQALIIGWAFATFLQGVGGFGVPVAVIAPILVSLGFTPLVAVLIPSLGHGWAVTFGSLGSSFQALIATSGLPGETLAPLSAIFLSLAGLISGYMIVVMTGGWLAVRRLFWQTAFLGLAMGVIHYLIAIAGLWNLAGFSGGLAGLLVSYPLVKRNQQQNTHDGILDRYRVMVALSGYVVLIGVILAIQLIPSLNSWLSQVVIQVRFPEVITSMGYITPAGFGRKIPIFRHAGATLLYASFLAYLIYRRAGWYQAQAVRRIVLGTIQRVMTPTISIISMVTMAVIMENSGMTDTLANGLAQGVSFAFPLVAPWIGALGAFMTGSNTNSNVVFSTLQMRTAQLLGYQVVAILAGQTAGASLASVIAPTKIVVGTSTAGMAGQEGEVIRKLLVYVVPLLVLVSMMTWIASVFF